MSAALVPFVRLPGESKNSGLVRSANRIQDIVDPRLMELEALLKRFPRDEEMSRATGLDASTVPGYRKTAKLNGVCARTEFTRRKKLAELGMGIFHPHYDEHGRPDGSTFLSRIWKNMLDGLKADPQIAKTPDGEIITRNRMPLSVEEAEARQIRYVTTVAAAPARAAAGIKGAAARGLGAGNPITAVLTRFRILDDGRGAAALLEQARAEVPDITPADLAEALGEDLEARAERKRRKNQTLSINVPYVSTFIGHLARVWAAWRKESEREAALRAERATRAQERERSQALEIAYEAFANEAMEQWLGALAREDYLAVIADASREIRRQYPGMTAAQVEDAARGIVRHEWRKHAGVASFADWLKAQPPGEPRAG